MSKFNRLQCFIIKKWTHKIILVSIILLSISNKSYASGLKFKKPSPLFNKGDIYTRTATGDAALAVGTNGQILSSDSSTLTGLKWVTPNAGGSGTVTNSGTLTSNAVIIGAGTTVVQAITADTSTTHALFSTATSPAFRDIVSGDIASGIFPISRGGTGQSTNTKGDLLTGTGSAWNELAVGTTGQILSADSTTATGLKWISPAFGTVTNTGNLTSNALVIGTGTIGVQTITADTSTTEALFSTTTSPAFRSITSADVTGVFGEAKGGTGQSSNTKGDLLVGGDSTSWLKLPVGTNGQMLSADSSTTTGLKWVAPPSGGSGSPGGSSTQIQFNSGGNFGGASAFTWDSVNTRLALGLGASNSTSFDIAGSSRNVPFALTDGSSIAIDLSRSNFFTVTLAGSRTLSNPTNAVVGQKFIVLVSQDSTGSRKLQFGTNYKFGTDVVSYDASTLGGTKDYVGFIVSTNVPSIDIVSVSKGYR